MLLNISPPRPAKNNDTIKACTATSRGSLFCSAELSYILKLRQALGRPKFPNSPTLYGGQSNIDDTHPRSYQQIAKFQRETNSCFQ